MQPKQYDAHQLTQHAKEYLELKPSRFWYNNSSYTEGYLISKQWLKNWKKYVNYKQIKLRQEVKTTESTVSPGPINNDALLKLKEEYYHTEEANDIYNSVIKADVRDRTDYTIKTPKVWEFLHKLYGGTAIKRKTMQRASYSNFDISFQCIELIVLPRKEQLNLVDLRSKPIYVGKEFTVKQMKERIIKVLNSPLYKMNLKSDSMRMWKPYNGVTIDALNKQISYYDSRTTQYIEANSFEDGSYGIEFPGYSVDYFTGKDIDSLTMSSATIILIIEQADDKKFLFKRLKNPKLGNCESCRDTRPLVVTCKCKKAFYCSNTCLEKDKMYHIRDCSYVDDDKNKVYTKTNDSQMGSVGLVNLGNTCFMNSGLQCLSHSTPLTYYILNNLHEKDFNPNNPLGSKCQLVKAYAKLIKELWFETSTITQPIAFKNVIGKVNEIFSGYQQHDSQELISCILDIIHEDINRVKKKPLVDIKTYNDESKLNEASIESWNGFLLRNQSVISDFFYGQFISRLKCPKCSILSYQFDPFNLVSVPIPVILKSEIAFEYIPYNVTDKCIFAKVKNKKGDTITNFRKAVGELLHIDPYSFIILCLDKNSMDMERIIGHKFQAKKVCKWYSKRNDHIALTQINPKVWKNETANKGFEKVMQEMLIKYPKLEEKKVNKKHIQSSGHFVYADINSTVSYSCIEEECDFNNGLDTELTKILVHFRTFEPSVTAGYTRKSEIVYPRYVHISRNAPLAQLYHEVFELMRPILVKAIQHSFPTFSLQEFEKMDTEKSIQAVKQLFSLNRKYEKYEQSFENGLPFMVRLVPPHERTSAITICCYCKKSDCKGCSLPMNSLVKDIMEKRSFNSNSELNKYKDNNIFYSQLGFSNRIDLEVEVIYNEALFEELTTEKISIYSKLLPIESQTDKGKDEIPPAKVKTLDECFDSFTVEEQLGEQDTWFCPNCKEHVRAWKKLQIYKAPHILIVHLKRFKGNKIYSSTGKIDELVDCPLEVDFDKYIRNKDGKSTIYKLYSIVNHIGSLGFGHYTAHCFSHLKNSWLEFNDQSVSELGSKNPVSTEAYVLFYMRKDLPFEISNYEKYTQVAVEAPHQILPTPTKKNRACCIQ